MHACTAYVRTASVHAGSHLNLGANACAGTCVCARVREMMEVLWLCLQAAAATLCEEGVHIKPDTCFAQNELWIEAKLVLFSTQLTTEAKDLRRDRMGLASLRALNNKPSSLRKHEGYESLLTLIDSLITWNWILIDFSYCMLCFESDATQLKRRRESHLNLMKYSLFMRTRHNTCRWRYLFHIEWVI